MRARSARS
jgi:hypothetical protein